jgi:alkylation response protein AidB-like acyl-CoA dehydrogenase
MPSPYFPLSERQREWAERAEAVAARELAPRAAETDRSGQFPAESLAALKREGFWSLRVAPEHGGQGADLLTTILVVEALAAGCASTALCYKMHLEAAEMVCRAGTPDQVERLVRPIVTGQAMYTVAGTEAAGRGGAFAPSNTMSAVTPVDGGYRVENARKSYVTAAGHATHFFFMCRIGADTPPGQTSALIVEADRINWKIEEPWDGLGMRGNQSSPVTFNGVVPPANLLGTAHTFMADQRARFLPVVLGTYAATYLGVAAGAYAEAARFLAHPYDEGKRRIDSEVLRHRMATLSVDLERSRALLYAAASAFDQGHPGAVTAAYQAKVACTETATHLTAEVMSLGGGTAFARRLPFERYFRDARAGPVMGVGNDTALAAIGGILFPKP